MLENRVAKALFMLSVLSFSLLIPQFTGSVVAEGDDEEEDPLAEAGLTLVALRNDTLDTNQDGDIDVLSASRDDDKFAWYENNGSESFTARTITTSADGTGLDT